MRILVCNDDGIYSPGIAALAEVASAFGTVRIVAPNVEQSSMGHAITASRPLSYRAHPDRRAGGLSRQRHAGRLRLARRVQVGQGRPRAVGLQPRLQSRQLDLAFGHARRREAGGAARLRGIAFSAPSGIEDFTSLKPWMQRVLDTLIRPTELNLVNVNLPRDPRGLIWTRVSVRQYDGVIVPTKDPMGRELYWFSVTPLEGAEEGTDRWAIEQNWISLTPLCLDLTDQRLLAAMPRAAAARRGARRESLAAAVVARRRQESRGGGSVTGDRHPPESTRPNTCRLGESVCGSCLWSE